MTPHRIDTTAPVISRRGTTIGAPTGVVFALQTAVDDWPAWNPAIASAKADAPLAPGVSFRWSTAGMDITSTVHTVEPGRRILWSGTSGGILGIHEWLFEPAGGGTRVHTNESWSGSSVAEHAATLQIGLDESLDAWLAHLKARAEGRQPV